MIPKRILPTIVIAQFCCTALWFAGNGIIGDLITDFNLPNSAIGHLTSSVQFGFIIGTLIFAILSIADRFSPSLVFFCCAIAGAFCNLGISIEQNSFLSLLILRFLTGFYLAGIYPVGMKIAADYFSKDLGKSLGYLVGALVLGTAFPHLAKSLFHVLPWCIVIYFISGLAIFGGLLIFILVPDGPHRQKMTKPDFRVFFRIFHNRAFRKAALGYFGHMWELYAFWTFIPFILDWYMEDRPIWQMDASLLTFFIIGIGSISCVIGGYLSLKIGLKKVALVSLLFSGICCLVSPWILMQNNVLILMIFLLFWGMVVIADSPLFSTLVANSAELRVKGTALTIVNCIGFAITIVSIQFITTLSYLINPAYLLVLLALGPMTGLIANR